MPDRDETAAGRDRAIETIALALPEWRRDESAASLTAWAAVDALLAAPAVLAALAETTEKPEPIMTETVRGLARRLSDSRRLTRRANSETRSARVAGRLLLRRFGEAVGVTRGLPARISTAGIDTEFAARVTAAALRHRADLAELAAVPAAPAVPGVPAPEVVTLCGSMRFLSQMLHVAAEETAAGLIVLAPFSVVPREDQQGKHKVMLDELHRRKIDLSSRVIVVSDATGYYGTSTAGEIAYASGQGKPIAYRAVKAPETPSPPAAVEHLDKRGRLVDHDADGARCCASGTDDCARPTHEVDGEDVPVRLDAAAAALEAGQFYSLANDFHDERDAGAGAVPGDTASRGYAIGRLGAPVPPPDVDQSACPLDGRGNLRPRDSCGQPWGHCADDCADPTEPHGQAALRTEIHRLRAVLAWADVNDRFQTAQKAKMLGREYGRASRTIADLRGRLARAHVDAAVGVVPEPERTPLVSSPATAGPANLWPPRRIPGWPAYCPDPTRKSRRPSTRRTSGWHRCTTTPPGRPARSRGPRCPRATGR